MLCFRTFPDICSTYNWMCIFTKKFMTFDSNLPTKSFFLQLPLSWQILWKVQFELWQRWERLQCQRRWEPLAKLDAKNKWREKNIEDRNTHNLDFYGVGLSMTTYWYTDKHILGLSALIKKRELPGVIYIGPESHNRNKTNLNNFY